MDTGADTGRPAAGHRRLEPLVGVAWAVGVLVSNLQSLTHFLRRSLD